MSHQNTDPAGTRTLCGRCGEPIEYVTDPTGDYWRHVGLIPEPLHGATPTPTWGEPQRLAHWPTDACSGIGCGCEPPAEDQQRHVRAVENVVAALQVLGVHDPITTGRVFDATGMSGRLTAEEERDVLAAIDPNGGVA